MTFKEAVEITKETYNNYPDNADNDLKNLDIKKFRIFKIKKRGILSYIINFMIESPILVV